MGIIGLIISPFLFVFLIIYFIFQYGEVRKSVEWMAEMRRKCTVSQEPLL